jgi:predicted cupin superfamily sugar epimerase
MAPSPYWLLLSALWSLAAIPNAVLCRPEPQSQRGSSTARTHTPINKRSAHEIIDKLGLVPNDEKGYYVQTFEDPYTITYLNRSASTAIYYLLEGADGDSIWHRVDAVEVWHYYAGAPLIISLSFGDGEPLREQILGPDVFDGQQPQVVIQKSEWQSARSLGAWTLVGTTGW